MHDEEAASPRWKLNPKNFSPYKKSIKLLESGGGVKKGSVRFPETTIFLGQSYRDALDRVRDGVHLHVILLTMR